LTRQICGYASLNAAWEPHRIGVLVSSTRRAGDGFLRLGNDITEASVHHERRLGPSVAA
jgi:hypothetical protein